MVSIKGIASSGMNSPTNPLTEDTFILCTRSCVGLHELDVESGINLSDIAVLIKVILCHGFFKQFKLSVIDIIKLLLD